MVGLDVFVEIPYDEQVVRASALGTPVLLAYPTARAAQALGRLAAQLALARPARPSTASGRALARVRHAVPILRRGSAEAPLS